MLLNLQHRLDHLLEGTLAGQAAAQKVAPDQDAADSQHGKGHDVPALGVRLHMQQLCVRAMARTVLNKRVFQSQPARLMRQHMAVTQTHGLTGHTEALSLLLFGCMVRAQRSEAFPDPGQRPAMLGIVQMEGMAPGRHAFQGLKAFPVIEAGLSPASLPASGRQTAHSLQRLPPHCPAPQRPKLPD